jgi:hypothetical protein
MGMANDILRSWRAPRRVMRDMLDRGAREDHALAVLFGACLLIFVAQWPALARAAHLDPSVPLMARIGGALMGWMFIAPLLLYAIAGLAQGAVWLTGRRADGLAVRLALFWALLVSAPLWLLHGLLRGLVGTGLFTTASGFVVLGAFFLLWGALMREAVLEAPRTSA